ncbi:hypothetical protein CK203_050468 [Vitis vinifera]|uniref:Uncharacterized protein n=1 Tax=Vitis vinifera TaxID=29760 RepID=A0A438H2I2_VITVI|nr:hypothetical protein CK203_050468 [Vitis vinifera]
MCLQNLLRMSSKDVYSASFPVASSLLQVLYQAVAPRYGTKYWRCKYCILDGRSSILHFH